MGSSRKHRERDNKDKYVSRSRSKSRDREKSERSHRSSHRYRDKDKESSSSSRKRTRDSSDDDKNVVIEKKLKVKEVTKYSNSSVNKSLKLEENNFADNERQKRDGQRHKEDDVRKEGSNGDNSLSIEETNKLRVKLGLKPLKTDDNNENKSNSNDNQKDDTEVVKPKEVFVKTEKISAKLEEEKIRERLATHREKRKIHEKLKKIKTLGQSDSEDEETTSWVFKSRQIEEEKARAAKRAQMLEEMDREFGVSSLIDEDMKIVKAKTYSSKDLKGLTVGHKSDAFQEGQQLVLTLKDKDVLNEEEDVLENVNIVDNEKANKNVENKLKRPEYKPYDEPELDEFGILKKSTLLSKYDEEIEGPKKDSFKLGINSTDKAKELELIRLKLRQQEGKISLVLPEPKIANEYYTHEEMTQFKKPKKVRKVLRKNNKQLELIDVKPVLTNNLSSDYGSRKKKPIVENDNEVSIPLQNTISLDKIEIDKTDVDDMDISVPEEVLSAIVLEEDEAEKELQQALHKARKLKLRDNVDTTTGAASIVKVAQTVKSQLGSTDMDSSAFGQLVSSNIILNSTAEFCRNLGDIPTYGMAGNRDEDEDLIEFERELIEERNKLNNELEPNRGTWNEVEMKEENDNADQFGDSEGQPILEEEPDVSQGLAGALKLAMKKGYLDKEVKKQASAQRNSLLEAQSYTIEEKFYEDDKVGRRERYNGPVSEFREKDTYRPEIKLDYVDEKGRVLDQKEAFRHLSHKFHGKGPGKNKIDKRMKKKDQESKLRQMSSTDTPLNTLKMLQDKQKELQSPYIVLTGGQKTGIQTTISKTK